MHHAHDHAQHIAQTVTEPIAQHVWAYGSISIIAVSLLSFIGGLIFVVSKSKLQKVLPYLVSLSVGALLGDAFLHLLPEAFESAASASFVGLSVLGGFFAFLLLEHGLHWHHSHDAEEDGHDHGKHIGSVVIVADGIHNFIDGIIIALGFMLGVEIGIATTIAVVLHEVPQEIGDIGLLIYAGWSRAKALLFNFISACFSVLGFGIVFAFQGYSAAFEEYLPYLLACAAGGFLYLAGADLIPELRRNHRKNFSKHVLVICLGILAMGSLLFLE